MSRMSMDATLATVRMSAPEIAAPLERLGLSAEQYPQETLAWALDTLALPANVEALQEHAALWREACNVCWQTSTVSQIIQHILDQHHVFLRLELPRIQILLHRAVNREASPTVDVARAVLDAFVSLKAEIEMHLLKEEQILFPLVREIEKAAEPFQSHCGSVRNPISVMIMEHDNAKDALQQIRKVTQNYRKDPTNSPLVRALSAALAQLERDLLAHIREEDDILFPRAIALEDELFTR